MIIAFFLCILFFVALLNTVWHLLILCHNSSLFVQVPCILFYGDLLTSKTHLYKPNSMEFFLMLSLNSVNSVTKKKLKSKRKILGLEPRISCVRDRDSTTQPQNHGQHSRSLYWTQFMPQWFLRFSEFPEFTESSAPFRENSNEIIEFDERIMEKLDYYLLVWNT